MCPEPIGKGRRNYCSNECAEDYRIRTSGAFARRKVYERDRGVCAECGLDTDALQREVREAMRADHAAKEWVKFVCVYCEAEFCDHNPAVGRARPWRPRTNKARDKLVAHGYNRAFAASYYAGECLWEADHIVPVVEGGGGCGLDNYRTLCKPCHKRYTAGLAKRRAHERRRLKKREQRLDGGEKA